MDEASITAVQSLIDDHPYPPTHVYEVRTLRPLGALAQRLGLLLQICPGFFQAGEFLDIGASKGFFSLRAARLSDEVLAIDPNREVLASWAPICPDNVKQVCSTFREFAVKELEQLGTFDMIWLGNGHHYAHREDPTGWISRLASLARDRVVVEGPIGKDTPGFRDWAPGTVPEEADWLAEAEKEGLRLQRRRPSPSYTPGRAIWFLRKI